MATFRFTLTKRAYPRDDLRQVASKAGCSDQRFDTTPVGFEAWMTA